jgi:hypothetical protein
MSGCAAKPQLPYPEKPSWVAQGEDPESRFGYRACFAGDLNGSGYSDLIVGAPGYDRDRGKVYVYLGGPNGLPSKPDWTFEGEAPGDAFGDRVGSAGDVNGDGFGDIYVTASSWGKGQGKLYVFYGGPKGLPTKPSWSAHGVGKPPLSFGDCTVPTGDLNGDGYDDLAVGAYGFDGTRGEVFVYYGSKNGLGRAPGWQVQGEARGDQLGYGLGPAGDVNKDGYDDLIIAAKYHSEGLPQQGKAYLYQGGPKGLGTASWTALGDSGSANLGTRVYGCGDLNGAGYPGVLIGAPYAQGGKGEVLAYAGGPDGLSKSPFMRLAALDDRSGFGFCLGPLGRMGPNREPGFFVSSHGAEGGVVDIYEYSAGQGPVLVQSIRGGHKDGRFGMWCAPAGDVRGAGTADLCISDDTDGPGRVEVYYGNAPGSGLKNPDAALAYFLGNAKIQGIKTR